MLPPAPMLATKNISRCGVVVFLILAISLTGCGPPGPRALLKGKKLLSSGDYSAAVEKLKTATALMSTNAQAWNDLGVAYQHVGRPADAVVAYQRALTLDRDMVEAHYNLGCLWLEQAKPDMAKTEFTAYVLRRSKEPDGWNKLGVATLRLHDLPAAEKSFNTALAIDASDAQALNGLGMAQMQRGRPRDAARYFASATRVQPDYAPALVNLATVARQYLHDNTLALQNYRAYLALTPHRTDWDQVNAIANDLERQMTGTVASATSSATHPQRPVASTWSPSRANSPSDNSRGSSSAAAETSSASVSEENPVTIPATPAQVNKTSGVIHQLNPLNWFRSASPEAKTTQPAPSNSSNNPPRPAPKPGTSNLTAFGNPPHPQTKPVHLTQPAPSAFPRYLYLSPSAPGKGNREAAGRT